MSNEPRHLRDWIGALFAALETAEPQRAEAIRRIAASDSARIGLDSDRVKVDFRDGRLRMLRLKDDAPLAAPSGVTDGDTVAAILSGWLELNEAIALDRITVRGDADEVMRIAAIVEILIDASTRIPAMQALSRAYLASRPAADPRVDRTARRAAAARDAADERALLRRAGLLG